MDATTHEQWNKMTESERADVIKSRLPKQPTPSMAIEREAPKPLTGITELALIDFGAAIQVTAPVATTLPTADVARIRGQARAEVAAALAAAIEADVDLTQKVQRLEALRQREQLTREEHTKASKTFEAGTTAARLALERGDDPGPLEVKRDEWAATSDRLGVRLGELAELIRRAEEESIARDAATRRARTALREKFIAKWLEAVKPVVKALDSHARALIELQTSILSA